MNEIEFDAWPKTPRLFRDIVITEKIDGTNAAIVVTDDGRVGAQSRKRLVTPEMDNHGFAAWVDKNAAALAENLGPGRHFGEWWGSGIQRGYGRTNGAKTFSLFNTARHANIETAWIPGLSVVPVIYTGPFEMHAVRASLRVLEAWGSYAAPGFRQPEGIVVYHRASNAVFKVTIENDEAPKGLAA